MTSLIRVLVIDDSALMRKLLTEMLNSDPSIEVVGSAMDANVARNKIKKLNPDVLTLDVEMPKMDGLQFLGNLMRLRPMPVVMLSSLTERGAKITMRALDLGAVDFVNKPKVDLVHKLEDCAVEIITKVKAAATAQVRALVRHANDPDTNPGSKNIRRASATQRSAGQPQTSARLVAIGASTGGTEAIKEILIRMQPDSPGVVIVQHIPPVFSRSFAERINGLSPLTVCEASNGEQIFSGHAYVAPGDQHLMVIHDGTCFRCKLYDGPPINHHKPSVDVLFKSVAENAGSNAIGVILTGMGHDGARGLKDMRDVGAATVAQDEQSSVIWGMPQAAIQLGAANKVLPLRRIAAKINALANA